MITVVGIGFGKDEISVKGLKAVKSADKVIARTLLSPAAKAFKKEGVISLDSIFEEAEDFTLLDEKCAQAVRDIHFSALQENSEANVVYLVEGDGYGDTSAQILIREGAQVIAGSVSGGGADRARMQICAYELCADAFFWDSASGLLVTGIDSRDLAGEVKLKLLEVYPHDEKVEFIDGRFSVTMALEEIDRQKKYGCDTRVYIGGNDCFEKKRYTFSDLIRIMARLTGEGGCPWDKAQTHESICINLIEEAYEAVDALQSGNLEDMTEELGDVLLQAVFHCDIAKRYGEFTLQDVISALCYKLVSRHTHIFGENKAADSGEALSFWEKAKAVEKSYSSVGEQLDLLPQNFPALLKLAKTHKKATKAGLGIKPQQIKDEFLQAVKSAENDCDTETLERLLFYAVLYCTQNGIDCETELSVMTGEYAKRIKRNENGQNA